MKTIKDHVAIVTGSATGVGAATAIQFAERGCNVVINYTKSVDEAKQTQAECEKHGVGTLLCQADVSDNAACQCMVAEAINTWGRVDYLVNNAGTTKFVEHSQLDGLDKEDFLRIYSVNTVGPFQMSRAVEPHMRQQGAGSIVNVASMAALAGTGSCIAYAASKGALVTMTLSLARALGPHIRVNAVCPGFIEGRWLMNGMGAEKYEAVRGYRAGASALGANSTPEDVADAILYFSTAAGLVTGETIKVDGGHHLGKSTFAQR